MPIRVLVADPDRYLLASYQEQLSAEGFEVATARDGLECLRRLRRFKPDVLVLEPAIPWGGGDGIVSLMHEEPSLAHVRMILVLTHGCSPHVLYNMAAFPIDDYLAKPMAGKRLARRIRIALGRREAAAAAGENVEWVSRSILDGTG